MNLSLLYAVLIGLLVGALVGMTGNGAGTLLVPLLILLLHVSPLVAVGSGVAFSFLTKIGAAWVHLRQQNVEWKVVGAMATGSIPGALIGVGSLALLRQHYGDSLNPILKNIIGVLLILIPPLMLLQDRFQNGARKPLHDHLPAAIKGYSGAALIGLIGGSLVGLTAIGAGSVIMMLFLLFFRRDPPVMIGTNIMHGLILAAVAALAHARLGTVDMRLVLWLLIGSVPGAVLGSRLTAKIHSVWLRRILLAFVMAAGAALL